MVPLSTGGLPWTGFCMSLCILSFFVFLNKKFNFSFKKTALITNNLITLVVSYIIHSVRFLFMDLVNLNASSTFTLRTKIWHGSYPRKVKDLEGDAEKEPIPAPSPSLWYCL